MGKQQETFWDRVVEAMRDAGYKSGFQVKAARMVGISQPSVAKWAAGGLPDTENLATLAVKLDVSSDWLLTGRSPKRLPDPTAVSEIDGEALTEAVTMFATVCGELGTSPPIEKQPSLIMQLYDLALDGNLTRRKAEALIGLTL